MAAAVSAGCYQLGRLIKDRPTGVAAGMLAATSVIGATGALQSEPTALACLFLVCAIVAIVRGQLGFAIGLATAAAAFRSDLGLVGLAVALGAVAGRQKYAAFGLIGAILGILLLVAIHLDIRHPLGVSRYVILANWTPLLGAVGSLVWFTVPFVTEIADREGRARWAKLLPVVLVVAVCVLFDRRSPVVAICPLLPLLWVVLGAGISRLIPSAVGDLPSPTSRYIAAALAAALILAMRLYGEFGTFGR